MSGLYCTHTFNIPASIIRVMVHTSLHTSNVFVHFRCVLLQVGPSSGFWGPEVNILWGILKSTQHCWSSSFHLDMISNKDLNSLAC